MTKTPNATPQPNYPDQIISDKPQPGAEHAALFAAHLRRMEQEARELPGPSPTAGMNLGQRILHVGGRENEAGYIEFGSVAAVRALVGQVLRDLQPTHPLQSAEPAALAEVSKEQYARMFGAACDALGQISDHLGIDSDINPGAEPIIEAIDELRACGTAQPQTYPVLDGQWRRQMVDGTVLVRDEMGCGDHPALPMLEEDMNPLQFFGALGIELTGSMAESQMDADAYEAMVEACDSRVWTPARPDGEGWVLVSIFETEDGPAAWWIREALPAKPERKSRKAAAQALEGSDVQRAVLAERERICAAIQAEDDYCVTQGDYMLDSNDCIKVARGEWVRPVFDAARAAQGGA